LPVYLQDASVDKVDLLSYYDKIEYAVIVASDVIACHTDRYIVPSRCAASGLKLQIEAALLISVATLCDETDVQNDVCCRYRNICISVQRIYVHFLL